MIAWLSVLPRRHARRVVMVMVAMSQWSHFKGDSRAAAMPLSIYFALVFVGVHTVSPTVEGKRDSAV